MARKRRANKEGTIHKHKSDGRWMGVIDLGWRNGKRVRKCFYGKTQREVQEKLSKARSHRDAGIPVAVERQTTAQFLNEWLEHSAKPSIRPRTYERYRQLVSIHLIPTLGPIRIEKLSPQQVQRLLNEKIADGLAPKTVRHIRGVLITALNHAVKWGLASRNVAALVDGPKVEHHEVQVLTPEKARQFLEAVKDERWEALYVTALSLGLRRGEVLGLRWSDVDLDGGILRISKALQRVNGKLELSDTKTKRARRTLALPESVVQSLRRRHARQLQERLIAGSRWQDSGFVFTTGIGTPVDPANLLDDFKRVLLKAGLPHIRFHDLRHSAASLLLAKGVHARVVMDLLGHSQISLTMDTYSHVMPDLLREAADKMELVLAEVS